MKWKKLGLVWAPDGSLPWARTHAMGPCPYRHGEDRIRVYVTCLDAEGRGRPGWVDVATDDPTRVIAAASEPLLDIGVPGAFDDNGVMVLSLIEPEPGRILMYYAGFELCTHIRYRIMSGVAVSTDGGATFRRHSEAPVLDRSDGELFFRGGPCAVVEGGRVKLWYVGGSRWIDIGGKPMPVYDLRYLESDNGLSFAPQGRVVMELDEPEEHGFGRPWIVPGADGYELYYSIRKRTLGAYRLGYARSVDGIHWDRQDEAMGLDPTPGDFDGQAISYSAPISVGGRTYCFYNGDGFGRAGFAVAERVA